MNPQADHLLNQALQCLQGANLDQAQQHLIQAISLEPGNPNALRFLGIIAAQRQQYSEALNYLNRSFKSDPANFLVLSNIGNIYSELKDYGSALNAYEQSLAIEPRYEEAWANRANVLYELGRYDDALIDYEQALRLQPEYAQAMFSMGNTLYALSRFDESIKCCDKALGLIPDFAQGWFIVGDRLNALGRHGEAITHYDKALSLVPQNPEIWINKGVALQALKRFEEAIVHYDKAIGLAPDYAQAYSNKGNTLCDLGFVEEAATHQQKAIALKPDYVEAWYNLGIALTGLKRYEEAIAHYDKAISLRPDYLDAWMNKGVTLQSLKRLDEAIDHYDKLLKLKPDYSDAYSNKGNTLFELKRYREALAQYEKALTFNPSINWIAGDALHTAMKISGWSDIDIRLSKITSQVSLGQKAINPFAFLALIDDPLLHKQAADIYVQSKHPFNPSLNAISKCLNHQKIRIAYFSPDFRNHPVACLAAELFELHDQDRFEIFAFSSGGDDGSSLHLRLRAAFNHFIDIRNMSDLDVAVLARKLEIDIAIDLGGHTSDSRTGVFAYRVAPIQINYLGYPGTMGAEYMDYIIADNTLIPKNAHQFYSEKIIYLPGSYQVNDRRRTIANKKFTREELGLPDQGFVFCCFNNNYKILPKTFDSWMRILQAVSGSVLWLFEDNSLATENLKLEASKRGVDPARLIFANRLELPEHLARHQQADLFLDTWPYNAHTTASDALWTGLPIVSLAGKSFASRVGASLLNAIGLPELVVNKQEQYELLAIELAQNPDKLRLIKKRLGENRATTSLFNTALFVKNIETAYIKIYDRNQAGLNPDHQYIS